MQPQDLYSTGHLTPLRCVPSAPRCVSVSLYLCISVSLYLCVSVSLWLCGSVALWLCVSLNWVLLGCVCLALCRYRHCVGDTPLSECVWHCVGDTARSRGHQIDGDEMAAVSLRGLDNHKRLDCRSQEAMTRMSSGRMLRVRLSTQMLWTREVSLAECRAESLAD
jgi:hypothetical protein